MTDARPYGARRPGESVSDYADRVFGGITTDSTDTSTSDTSTATAQARRLLSGAGGGGPTGGATEGVDPSAGAIPGTPESVLPVNWDTTRAITGPRDDASDPTRHNVTTDERMGIGALTIVLLVAAVAWVIGRG